MNRRRLEAEAAHDALLAIAGRLDTRAGGPADAESTSLRRMLYIKTTRSASPGFGALFDGANPAMHVDRRTVSTVAPQALYLMNDPMLAEAARGVVERPDVAGAATGADRIQSLYKVVFGRSPTSAEVDRAIEFIEQATGEPISDTAAAGERVEPWEVYTQALLLTNEFLFID
jgi:hypothetical protein